MLQCRTVDLGGVSVPTLLYSRQPNLPPLPTLGFLESCLWVLLTVLLFVAFSSLGAFLCIFIILFLVSLSTAPLPAQTHSAQSSGLLFLGGTVRRAVRQINDLHSQGLCFGDLHSLRMCVSKTTVTSPLTRSDNPWIQWTWFFFKSYLNQTQGLCMCECRACVCARAHVRAHACVCLKRARLLLQTSLRRGLLPPNSLHDSSQKSNDTRDFLAGISQMECDRNTEWRLECRNFDRHAAFATKHIW